MDLDNNQIMEILYIENAFKTFKLIIIIFMVSYFYGIFFYILCDLQKSSEVDDEDFIVGTGQNFIDYFKVDTSKDFSERAIQMTYYMFTSLSTVGFGELNPRSNSERTIISFILLFGVGIQSYVLGNFVNMLKKLKRLDATFEDGDNLSKFFGLIQNFNYGKPINREIVAQIEEFFDYKWAHDKNQAVILDADVQILNELPINVKVRLFTQFLNHRFLRKHRKFFEFKNHLSKWNHSYFNWKTPLYENFMINVLQQLEPVRYQSGEIIIYELDSVDSVHFTMEGKIDIGYEMNREVRYKLRLQGQF